MVYSFQPIGVLRSCFTGKFGIPRQPRLVEAARADLELFPAYGREEAVAGLAGFSHLWLISVFQDCLDSRWRPTVRPPRLGGQRKVGVFASRSPYRPNPIGISAVENLGALRSNGKLVLRVGGADLLDGTPILDVKPYVAYADSIPDARSGFADEAPGRDWSVRFTEVAREQIAAADPAGTRRLLALITQILHQDPRPGYMDRYPERTEFVMRLYDFEVRWVMDDCGLTVVTLDPIPRD